MNDGIVFAEIESAVVRRVAAGEMFTALDISREVQARGVRRRHSSLKELTHRLLASGALGAEYGRTLIDVGGELGPAWLYHPWWADPAAYAANDADRRDGAERT